MRLQHNITTSYGKCLLVPTGKTCDLKSYCAEIGCWCVQRGREREREGERER